MARSMWKPLGVRGLNEPTLSARGSPGFIGVLSILCPVITWRGSDGVILILSLFFLVYRGPILRVQTPAMGWDWVEGLLEAIAAYK